MNRITTTLLTAPLVPVRETQKNITRYFEKGIARVTKNGRSLGYLLSDEMLDDIIEDLIGSDPDFVAKMEKIHRTEKSVPLDQVLKNHGIK